MTDTNRPAQAIRLAFTHPRGGKRFEAEITSTTTAREALEGLTGAGFLERVGQHQVHVLSLARTQQSLPLDASLVTSGVVNGDEILVTLVNEGAGRLTQGELRSRLALDWRAVRGLTSTHLGAVRSFVDATAERDGSLASDVEGEAGGATRYVVEYRMPIATGPDTRVSSTQVRFDLLASGNYPFSTPFVGVCTDPFPFSVRVHPETGTICLGEGWQEARGQMLLAQLVVHVMRLLNFDEPSRGATRDTFNLEALRFWKEGLRGAPLTPGLVYPVLPSAVTHPGERGTFRAVSQRTASPAARSIAPFRRLS